MNPVELVTIPEAARRLGLCSQTLKRRIARYSVIPDAILLEGPHQRRLPLFVAPRLGELQTVAEIIPS